MNVKRRITAERDRREKERRKEIFKLRTKCIGFEKEKALDLGTLFLTRNVSQINDCEITKLFRNEPPAPVRRLHCENG